MKQNKLLFSFALFSIIYAGNYQTPPIIVSTICGNLSEVKKECTPTNINAQNNEGKTALMQSCIHGSGDIFIFLIENNADIKVKDNSGRTALDYAIKHNRPEMIEFLLLSGNDENLSLDAALKKAAAFENINKHTSILFKELSKNLPDINIIKSCIDTGADVNANDNGWTALIAAEQYGHTEIARLLIDAGADVNTKANNGYTALMSTASCGNTEIARLLIAAGAEVNVKDNSGQTTLFYAAYEHTDIARLLITAGADINTKNNHGWTALMAAAKHGGTEIAKLLIDTGADVNARDNYGGTALMYAAKYGHTDIARLLIAAGADVNVIYNDYQNTTALKLSIANNHEDCAKLLINAGADFSGIDKITLFKLKHPNLYIAAVISATTIVYKLWQNFTK